MAPAMYFPRVLGLALALGGLAAAASPRAATVLAPADLLKSVGQFTAAECAAVERGQSVSRLLDTDPREIAVVGAVRIAGSADALVAQYRDIGRLKRTAVVLDASRFSARPQPSDLASLEFEEHSLDLRNCQAGDCSVRLNAADVARFQREVNWRGAEWRSQSAAVWRKVLASYAAGYLAAGRQALPEYVNKADVLSVPNELTLITRQFGFLRAYSPEFYSYLQDFGPRSPAGAEHVLYWTKEDFGVRPVVRITHQVIFRTSTPLPAAFIATNQVYADHYLDAALGLTLAIDTGAGGSPGFYMISINRARTRSLSGFLRKFARVTVQNRSREGMRKILATAKLAIEAAADGSR
jgi:hypothetical protein